MKKHAVLSPDGLYRLKEGLLGYLYFTILLMRSDINVHLKIIGLGDPEWQQADKDKGRYADME